MKLYRAFLHSLITGASLLGFLGGWVVLAHSPKPIQPVQPQTLKPLDPLLPIGQAGLQAQSAPWYQSLFPARPQRVFGGGFVTRGS